MAEKKSPSKKPAKPSRKGKESPKQGIDPKAEGRNLFMLGHHSQAQIAALLGVTENTVGRWKKEGNWDQLRAARISGRDETEQMLLDQITHITTTAKDEKRAISIKESMSIYNLTRAMGFLKPSNSLAGIVETGINFTTWVAENYPEEVKLITSRWDQFLTHHFQSK